MEPVCEVSRMEEAMCGGVAVSMMSGGGGGGRWESGDGGRRVMVEG